MTTAPYFNGAVLNSILLGLQLFLPVGRETEHVDFLSSRFGVFKHGLSDEFEKFCPSIETWTNFCFLTSDLLQGLTI